MKKKLTLKLCSILVLLIGFPTVVSASSYQTIEGSYGGVAQNNQGTGSTNVYDVCPSCKYVMSFNRVYTTYVATAPDGRTVTKTICNEAVAATEMVKCDVVDNGFELPLLSNGHTNPNYQQYVDNWLNQTIVNGQLNESSIAAQALAELYCGETSTISSACKKQIVDLVANEDNDLIDSNIYQGAIIKNQQTGEWASVNSYDDNLCSGNYSGVNQVLCDDLAVACLAGTSASYSKSNGNEIIQGSKGVCTWDSWAELEITDLNCKESCKAICKAASSENRIQCAKDCMLARAGMDESCPTCSQACEQECNGNSTCTSQCIKEKCDVNIDCVGDCCPGDVGYPNCPDEKPCTGCCPGDVGYPNCDSTCPTPEKYIPCTDVECEYTPIPYEDSSTGGGCGTTQTISEYELVDNICELAKIYKHVEINISYPPSVNPFIKYAGQGFNSNNKFSGTVTETTFVSDQGAISAAITKQEELKKALENQIDIAVAKEICAAEKEYQTCVQSTVSAGKSCAEAKANAQKLCTEGCRGTCDCSNAGPNCDEINPQNCKPVDEKAIRKKIEETYKDRLNEYDTEIERLQECANTASKYKGTQTTRQITTASSKMVIGSYSQTAFSIKGVDKNTGDPLTSMTNNSLSQTSEFYVPNTIANGSDGALIANTYVTYNGTSHEFSSTCPFKVTNELTCPSGGCSINVIYRPISLINPFPNSEGVSSDSRQTTAFWNDATTDIFIKNNRDVSNYEVYSLTPMYTITLTPSVIKEIRNYNSGKGNFSGQKHPYSDFNLDCTDGLYCKSTFLRETFNQIIDIGQSCGISDDWYACDSETLGNTRDSLLNYLR